MKRLHPMFPACAVLITALAAPSVWADDVAPPDYRDQPLSVFTEYDPEVLIENGDLIGDPFASFAAGPLVVDPSSPGFAFVDDDDPATVLYEEFPPSMRAEPGSAGNRYIIEQPNVIDELPIKFLRVQVTWVSPTPSTPTDKPTVSVQGSDPSGGVSVSPNGMFNAAIFSGGTWGGIDVYDFILRPNPDWELITINTGREDIYIDQVVVDSISIPEPAGVTLFALAAAGVGAVRLR